MRARFLADYRFVDPKDPYALQGWLECVAVETASRYAGIRDAQVKRAMGITN